MTIIKQIRTATPVHDESTATMTHWAALLVCGHTVHVEVPRRTRLKEAPCERCDAKRRPVVNVEDVPDELDNHPLPDKIQP